MWLIARQSCDEIEAIAPWGDLYAPPRDPVAAARLASTVHNWALGLRSRIDQGVQSLAAAAADPAFLEEVDIYLGAVSAMLRADVMRLGTAIESARRPKAAEEAARLACEIAADVKGKGTSSLMGATAALVAEGHWDPVATEPLLFAEKSEEFRRNQELLDATLELAGTIHRIRASEVVARLGRAWGGGTVPDRWSSADLGLLVAQTAQMLRPERRQALYAGDFHQLERRLRMLSQRVGELDRLHAAMVDGFDDPQARPRILALLREIAAIVDTGSLQDLLPPGELARLRSLLELSRQLDGHLDLDSAARRGDLPSDRAPLLALLADDDLATFVGLLAANVARRASFQLPAPAPTTPARTRLTSSSPKPREQAAETRREIDNLRTKLQALRADSFPGAREFRLVVRLLATHDRLPDALLSGCKPYLHALIDELVPAIEPLVDRGLVPASARHELVSDALAVAGGAARGTEAPPALRRLARVIDSLELLGR